MSCQLEPAISSRDTGQRIPWFDRCQLIITWKSNIKDNSFCGRLVTKLSKDGKKICGKTGKTKNKDIRTNYHFIQARWYEPFFSKKMFCDFFSTSKRFDKKCRFMATWAVLQLFSALFVIYWASLGNSDEIEDATIAIDGTKISEIELTKQRFRNYCVQTKY